MMSNSLKNQERKITTVILGFLLIGFFVPTNIAFAAASIPGITPSAPGPGNDVCFAARSSTTFSMNYEYCYATLATCTTNQALVVSPAVLATGCLENFSTVGLWQKTFGKTSYAGTQSILSPLYHIGDILEKAVLAALVGIAALFYKFASLFLVGMGSLLDIAISSTINSDFYSGLTVINIGWTAVRDFSNMFFIFALLFIAIKTILGMAGSSTKRWVANLIIAAILINFSLFATKVVIDAGNILALGFWSKMQVTSGGITGPSATMTLFQGLKLQSITDPKDSSGKPITLPGETKLLIYLGGGIFMFIAGYVFLAGAIMMMIRSVTLIILMIVSPFAFLGFGLPVAGGFANKWLSQLIGSAFVAPAFIAMLYLVSTIVNSPDLFKLTNANGLSMGGAIAGDISSYAIVYNYLLMIILVLASLSVANAVSSGAGSTAGAWAKKGIGGGAGAAALGFGAAGRQTLGRAGKNRLNDEKWVKEQNRLVAKGGMAGRLANIKLATYEKASKGTFDVRNAKVAGVGVGSALALGGVNAGQGTKRNYDQHGAVGSSVTGGYRGTDKEKELIETAKGRYKNAPDAQEAYLRRTLGKDGDKDTLEAARHKETLKQIERDKITVEEKNNLKKAIDPKAEGALIGEAAAEAIKTSFARLSGKESAEILADKPEYLKNPAVIAALTSRELGALDTSRLDAETTKSLSSGIVQNGTESARNYLKNQAKVGGVLQYDSAAELKKLTNDYDEKQVSLKGNDAEWKVYSENQKKEIGKALGMVGGATEITQLDDKLITHEALVSQYNSKIVREFQKKIKDGDFDGDFGEKLDAQLKAHNTRASKSTPTPSPIATPPPAPSLIISANVSDTYRTRPK